MYRYNLATIGPPAKRHFNGFSLAGRCWPNIKCWLGNFVIFQGIRIRIAKIPYIIVPPLITSGSAHGINIAIGVGKYISLSKGY